MAAHSVKARAAQAAQAAQAQAQGARAVGPGAKAEVVAGVARDSRAAVASRARISR